MRGLGIFAPVVGVVALSLTACGEGNKYAAPPPPKVTVANPVKAQFTHYLEATGNTAAINSADLVARVPGFLTTIRLSGRRGGEERHAAFHHRAGVLQAEA